MDFFSVGRLLLLKSRDYVVYGYCENTEPVARFSF